MAFKLQGVIPAMLTPFTRKGARVDYDRAAELAVYLADKGVHGLFVAGTTGEGLLMTLDERKRLLETVVQVVGKRLAVVAHTGCLDTASTIELTRHAAESGAVAAGVVAPGFYGYDDEALFVFFRTVARAVEGFPLFLYNLPSCAKNALSASLMLRLAFLCENVVGVKDSSGDMTLLSVLLGCAESPFMVINGVDSYTYQALVAGAAGSVASAANVAPELFLGIYNGVKKGDLKSAWKNQVRLNALSQAIKYGAKVALIKEALRMRGFDPGYVRPPQCEPKASERRQLEVSLRICKLT